MFPPAAYTSYSAPIGAASSAPVLQIDPNLDRDDWADLARTAPNIFLASLLAALAAPNPISTAGPSVEDAFKSHLASLNHPAQTLPIPSLYSVLKTFWLPASPAYFSLTASASTARTPSEHRFLYWDPQPLVFNGIACPCCTGALTHNGRIKTGPLKIYDLQKPFYIVGCEYVCKSSLCTAATSAEGRKFASTDSSILRSLPLKLQEELRVRFVFGDGDAGSGPQFWNWTGAGVSLSLWNMVRASLKAGVKKEVLLLQLHAAQHGFTDEDKHEEEEAEEDEVARNVHHVSSSSGAAAPDPQNVNY